MTKSIAQILKQKGRTVYSTTPETKIFDALKVMADNGVGALVVLNEKEHVV